MGKTKEKIVFSKRASSDLSTNKRRVRRQVATPSSSSPTLARTCSKSGPFVCYVFSSYNRAVIFSDRSNNECRTASAASGCCAPFLFSDTGEDLQKVRTLYLLCLLRPQTKDISFKGINRCNQRGEWFHRGNHLVREEASFSLISDQSFGTCYNFGNHHS